VRPCTLAASKGVSEECLYFCYEEVWRGEASPEKPSPAFDLPSLGLGPAERAEKGRFKSLVRAYLGSDEQD